MKYASVNASVLNLEVIFSRVRKIVKSDYLRSSSTRMSVRIEQLGSHCRISMKLDILRFLENVSRKLKFYYNRARIQGTVREDQYIFFNIAR